MLQDKVKELAALNKALEESKAWEQAKRERIEQLPEWHQLEKILEEQKEIKDGIDQAKADIQIEALKAYQETGNKKPADGVGIRVYKKLKYDTEQAIEWCKANLPSGLKLDTRTFEKHAKAVEDTLPLAFVEYYEDAGVTIASDLSDYLG